VSCCRVVVRYSLLLHSPVIFNGVRYFFILSLCLLFSLHPPNSLFCCVSYIMRVHYTFIVSLFLRPWSFMDFCGLFCIVDLRPLSLSSSLFADDFLCDEGCAGSEQSAGASQGGSPRSSPTQRTLGDFLGPEWKVVAPAGRRRGGKRASFAPGGRCAGFSAKVASSSDLPPSVEPSTCDFPPLPAPAVSGACPPVPMTRFIPGNAHVEGLSI
jgi:hypothetical protein